MKESTLKVVLPSGVLALVGVAVYWYSSPQGSRETAPPPPLASLQLPKAPPGAAASFVAKSEAKTTKPSQGDPPARKESSFTMANARDPFWPIGWTKPEAQDGEEASAAPALTPSAFSLTSIAIGAERRFVILNRKILHEGQEFGLQVGQQIYQITLKAVQDGQVILAYQGGEVVVPLQRK
jgi:hypothetical protein